MTEVRRVFRLAVDRETGALERVLAVARRRGLGLERLSVVAEGPVWNVQLQAGSVASEATLALAQFNALIDVRTAVMEDA